MKKMVATRGPPVGDNSEERGAGLLLCSAAGLGCWAAAALGGPRGQARPSGREGKEVSCFLFFFFFFYFFSFLIFQTHFQIKFS
jgi:hypothetical protein